MLRAGSRIGPNEILAPLGAGGMGPASPHRLSFMMTMKEQ
jgi:hypothetical protein